MPALPMLNLFGLRDDDGMSVLRRRYYEFALMCHPDRGGSAEDMVVVQQQYEHAKRELMARDDGADRMQQLEELAQRTVTEETPVPDMRAIFDEVHGAWAEANASASASADDGADPWHSMLTDSGNPMESTDGYGESMLTSAYAGLTEPPTYDPTGTDASGWNVVVVQDEENVVGDTVPPDLNDDSVSSAPRQTALVRALEGDCTQGFALVDAPSRATGFGLPTEAPRQLPLTDYAAACTVGQHMTDSEADMRAAAHVAVIEADVAERLAGGEQLYQMSGQ